MYPERVGATGAIFLADDFACTAHHPQGATVTTKTIAPGTPHCSQCARTDAEYVSNAYSGCCNEPVVWDCFGCTHNDDDSCGTTGCEAHDGECRDNWGEGRF